MIGIVGIIGACIIMFFLKIFIDNIRSIKCVSCRKYLHPLNSEKSESESLSIAVQAGLAGNVGYICMGCGKNYCQRCLESNGGVQCPNCGGLFKYLKN